MLAEFGRKLATVCQIKELNENTDGRLEKFPMKNFTRIRTKLKWNQVISFLPDNRCIDIWWEMRKSSARANTFSYCFDAVTSNFACTLRH